MTVTLTVYLANIVDKDEQTQLVFFTAGASEALREGKESHGDVEAVYSLYALGVPPPLTVTRLVVGLHGNIDCPAH